MKNKLLSEIKSVAKKCKYKLNGKYKAENLKIVFIGEHHRENAQHTADLVNFVASKNPSKVCFLEGLEGFSNVSNVKNKMNEGCYVNYLNSSINLVGVDKKDLLGKSYNLLRCNPSFRLFDFVCPNDNDFIDFISAFGYMPLSDKIFEGIKKLRDERSEYTIEQIKDYLKKPEFSEGIYPVVFGAGHMELLSILSKEEDIPHICLQAK